MKSMKVFGGVIIFLVAGVLLAQGVPQTVNYQGRLTDDTGLPLDGPVQMRFRLLDADTISASVLWSETQSSVQVDNGIYHVQLGSVNALPPSALSQADIYLEVIVEGEILRPRSPLTSVAFAHKAAEVPDGAITSAMIEDGTISPDDVGFNYAGSTSQGGAASDLACTDCVSSAEVQFNYAGSASEGGAASNLACVDCVSSTEVQFNYAASYSEGGSAINSDLLNFEDGSYYLDATNINAGTLGNPYFSAYSNLWDEGYLNNDAGADILTRTQSDARYLEACSECSGTFVDEWEVWDSNLVVNGDLQVNGNNIGISTLPNGSYGILNDSASAPSYGARLYGTSEGIRGALSSDPNDHYAYLGSSTCGIYARSGNTDEAGTRYGGTFYAHTQGPAYGIYGLAYGYGVSSAYGVRGYGYNSSSGPAYGGYFETSNIGTGTHYGIYSIAQSDLSSTTGIEARSYTFGGTNRTVYGVRGQAWNDTDGPSYGGHFSTLSTGTGERYGVYAECDSNSSTPNYGVYGTSANYGGSDTYGGYFVAENTGGAGTKYGVYGNGVGYGVYGEANSTGVYGTGVTYGVQGRSSNYGGRFEFSTDPSIHYANLGGFYYGVYARSGDSSMTSDMHGGRFFSYTQRNSYGVRGEAYSYSDNYSAYGVYGYASNTGDNPAYGGYFSTASSGSGSHYGVYSLGVGDSDTSWIYGVWARGTNYGDYPAIGGYFDTSSSGTGTHMGVYAFGIGATTTDDVYGLYAQASDGSANSHTYGVYASAFGGSHNDSLYCSSGDKHWVNPDPEDPSKSIVYTTLEGWESGTYFRGKAELKNGKAVITLPEHFRKVTSPDHEITVQVTPRSMDSQGLAVIKSTNSEIVVGELYGGKGNYEFDYLVQGVRLGYEDHEPTIDNVDYVPFQGNQSLLDDSEWTTQEWYDNQSAGLKKIFKNNGTLKADGKINEDLFKEKGWKIVKEKKEK